MAIMKTQPHFNANLAIFHVKHVMIVLHVKLAQLAGILISTHNSVNVIQEHLMIL